MCCILVKFVNNFSNLVFEFNFVVFPILNYQNFLKESLYIKTSYKNQLRFNSIYFKSINYSFVHQVVEKVKLWNVFLHYILKSTLFCSFFVLTKLRLKNIFLKVLNDLVIWQQIEKMIDFGLVSFEKKYIFRSFSYENLNSLSYFFFNVYFSEFDFYVFSRLGLK